MIGHSKIWGLASENNLTRHLDRTARYGVWAIVSHTDSYEHTWVKCDETVTLDRWGSRSVGKSNHLPGDRKAQKRKTELGCSRMGQSPFPGLTDLYPLSVSMEIICPG